MKITEIRVEQAGTLPRTNVTGLSPGFNVIVAPHGYGTVLVRHLRHLLFGLDDSGSAPPEAVCRQGVLQLEHGAASFELTRIDRAGHPRTMAITTRDCESRATEMLRALLEAADMRVVEQVQFVTADDWDGVDELQVLARQLPAHPGTVLPPELPPHRVNRETLASFAQRCEQLRLEIAVQSRSQTRRQREFSAQLQTVGELQDAIEKNLSWHDAELQATINDVREVEDRLWTPVVQPVEARDQPRNDATDRLETYVDHLRSVICDLAERRLEISRTLALSMTGAATPPDAGPVGERSRTIRLENERLRIDRCESELLHQLRCMEHSRGSASGQNNGAGNLPLATRSAVDEESLRSRRSSLLTRSQDLRRKLEATRSRQCEVHAEWRRIDTERRRIAADRTLDGLLYDLGVLEQQLAAAQIEQHATSLLERIHQRMNSSHETTESLRERATAFLAQLMGMEAHDLDQANDPLPSPMENSPEEPWLPFRSDACGSESAALALRLALLTASQHGGSGFPIVWDEALTMSDPERLQAAGRLLSELADQGQQIILLTSRPQVAAALEKLGGRLQDLSQTRAPDIGTADNVGAADHDDVPGSDPAAEPLVRIHPGKSHWLRAETALNELPSLGPQMSRQLRRMGLVDVGDLIALDLSKCAFLLSESRLTAEQVRLWQAEAELLCCVPDLTGRDAQLLVGCGLLTPGELAAARVDQLTARIDRLRGGETTRWLPYVGVWPRAETVRSWIHAARRAQSLESVFAAAARAGRRPRRWPSRIERETERVSRLVPVGHPVSELPSRPDVRLRPENPVVDAPAIGPKTARLLERIGIVTVGDLLACDAEATARRLHHPRITPDLLATWQRQSSLMCSIPALRCGDAQVLVACGIHQPSDLRRISASALSAVVGPFVQSVEGRRLLRSATPPTAEDVARWVEAAQKDEISRAA